MNLEAIYDLRERLEQAAIAGVKLLPEDFRLQRAVENAALLSLSLIHISEPTRP